MCGLGTSAPRVSPLTAFSGSNKQCDFGGHIRAFCQFKKPFNVSRAKRRKLLVGRKKYYSPRWGSFICPTESMIFKKQTEKNGVSWQTCCCLPGIYFRSQPRGDKLVVILIASSLMSEYYARCIRFIRASFEPKNLKFCKKRLSCG